MCNHSVESMITTNEWHTLGNHRVACCRITSRYWQLKVCWIEEVTELLELRVGLMAGLLQDMELLMHNLDRKETYTSSSVTDQ